MQGSGCRRGSGFCSAASETSGTQLSSADGVDNPPRDPVCHTSDLGHAVEKIKKGQLLKPLAPNSSSVDGVDNPPRDPVRHTSVSGHALGGGNSDSKGNAGRLFRINGSKRRQVRREKAAFRNPAGSEQINAEAFKSFDMPPCTA